MHTFRNDSELGGDDDAIRAGEEIELLVDELTERALHGEKVDVEAVLREHPDRAEQLRAALSALELMVVLQSEEADAATSGRPVEHLAAVTIGDFRIVQEIGRGGMGVVYEALQVSLGRRVALKVFPFAGICAPQQLQRFQNEARAAAGLHHDHIVPVFAVGCERGLHFYAMQFIEGRSLAALIVDWKQKSAPRPEPGSSNGAGGREGETNAQPDDDTRSNRANRTTDIPSVPTPRQVAQWGVQAAEALDYAHSLGVVHRDIKPANILLDQDGRIWITDFGLAQIASAEGVTMTGDVLGTLQYMSPEQAVGQRGLLDQRTDVYSLGATLYELLTRRPVFLAGDRAALLHQILHADPQPVRRLKPAVPQEFATIIHKSLERDVTERYQTAGQLADDLRRFLEERPIRARVPTFVDRLRKWSRRNRGLVRAATAFAALVTIGLTAAAFLIEQERHKTFVEQQARTAEARVARVAQRGLAINNYVNLITRAQWSIKAGRLTEAQSRLAECRPAPDSEDFRGFEWRYLQQMTRDHPPVGRHEGMAYCARVSPDRRLLATCGTDGVRIWDSLTFAPVAHLTDHQADVNGVAFSSDGQFLATAGDDRQVRIWSTANWEVEHVLPHDGNVVSAMFVPGTPLLATAERRVEINGVRTGSNVVRIWDTRTWQQAAEAPEHELELQTLDVAADGSLIASGGDDGVLCLWNVAESRVQHRLTSTFGAIRCVAFSPAGDLLATTGATGAVQVWETKSGKHVAQLLGFAALSQTVAFSPDAKWILVVGDTNAIGIWHWYLPGNHRHRCELLQRSPQWGYGATFLDQRRFVTVDRDGVLNAWDLQALVDHQRIPLLCTNPVDLAWLPNAHQIAVAGDGAQVYDICSPDVPRQLVAPGSPAERLFVTPDSKRLTIVQAGGVMAGWNTDDLISSGSTLLPSVSDQNPGPARPTPRGPDSPLLVENPSESTVAAMTPDGTLEVSRNGRPLWQTRQPIGGFLTGAIAPDARSVAVATDDGAVRIWNDEGGMIEVEFLSEHYVSRLAFSPNGKLLAGSVRGRFFVKLWNVATGRFLIDLDSGAVDIGPIAFAPDGLALAAIGRNPRLEFDLLLWDTRHDVPCARPGAP